MEEKIEQNLFTEEELKILNFSDEELDLLLEADATVKTFDMISGDVEKIFKRIDKEFPNDGVKTLEKFTELCKTDPKFITQLIAMNEVFSEVKPEVQGEAKVEKISTTDIQKSKTSDNIAKINQLLGKK